MTAPEPDEGVGDDADADADDETGATGGTGGTGRAGGTDAAGTTGPGPGDGTREDADIPDVAAEADLEALTGPMRSLDPRVRYVWVVQAVITAAFFGGIAGAVSYAIDFGLLPGVGLFLVVAVLGVGHALLRYRSWRYEVRGDSLYLERGVLTHVKTVVPFVRIQHVDASRGPVERLVGLASSVVYTAGSRGADVTIPGLTPEGADDLQARLKRLAIAAEGDDAV